jgi:hypothetical protein
MHQQNTFVFFPPTGEKLATVKKQLKVQKKRKAEPIASAPGPSKAKTKRKGIRLRKGVSVKVPSYKRPLAAMTSASRVRVPDCMR